MNRYIDADKLKEECYKFANNVSRGAMAFVQGQINAAPTADVVEVVRCKDCKHYCLSDFRKPNEPRWCELFNDGYFYPKEDFYCSYGERREK